MVTLTLQLACQVYGIEVAIWNLSKMEAAMNKKAKKTEVSEEVVLVQPKKKIQTAEGWKRTHLKSKKKEEKRNPRKSEAA
jgi:hypothetical protein